jgi:hypothetical protein
MTRHLTIAAEGVKRQVPPSFGIYLNGISAQKIIDELQHALESRSPSLGHTDHFWVSIHLNGDPCLFDGNPIPWK